MSMLVAVSYLMPVSFANQAVLMVKMIAGGNLQKASGEMNARVARLEFTVWEALRHALTSLQPTKRVPSIFHIFKFYVSYQPRFTMNFPMAMWHSTLPLYRLCAGMT